MPDRQAACSLYVKRYVNMWSCIKKIKDADWMTFVVVVLVVFVKNLFFHYSCFSYMALSTLWEAPLDFFAFYLAKLSPAIFIASFIFLIKRKWWLVPICFILDIWLIANMIYFRANGFFLDVDTIAMVGNMEGFWSSIFSYVNWSVFSIVGTTLFLAIYLLIVSMRSKRNDIQTNWRVFVLGMVVIVLLGLFDWFLGYRNTKETSSGANDGWKYNFITASKQTVMGNNPAINSQWVEAQSPMHFFPALVFSYAYGLYYHSSTDVSLTESDKKDIAKFMQDRSQLIPDGNLIIIVGESFESWVIGLDDEDGNKVVPNMTKYTNAYNCLYCSKIKAQVRAGTSGDGQMIINTGLLPISSGAACMVYGDNEWPNIVEYIYKNGYVVNPCVNVWNQKKMTEKYGYKYLVQNSVHERAVGDSVVFSMANIVLDSCSKPFCMQIITETTHVPFDCGGKVNMNFPAEMPDNLRNYLNCMHYADSCMGVFFDKLAKDSLMSSTTIVITGDHTIFKQSLLSEYHQFAQEYNYPIPAEESYCPLLILSPKINGNMKIEELFYQMDIYPTIIELIGAEGYSWKGFGVNILDSIARQNRPIKEREAYILSDKIIRSNYFGGKSKKIDN